MHDTDSTPDASRLRHIPLSRHQYTLLLQSWNRMCARKNGNNIGAIIFYRIFQLEPDVKRQFGFDGIPTPQLKHNAKFQTHMEAIKFDILRGSDEFA